MHLRLQAQPEEGGWRLRLGLSEAETWELIAVSRSSRNLVTQMSILWTFAFAALAMLPSLAQPILAATRAGASVPSSQSVSQEISVTITRAPSTSGTATAPPASTNQNTQYPIVVTGPKAAAATATPPPIAFTGAPLMALLEVAVLLMAGGAILCGRRFSRRRRT